MTKICEEKLLSIFIRRLPRRDYDRLCACGERAHFSNGHNALCLLCAHKLRLNIDRSIRQEIIHRTWLNYPYGESNKISHS